MSVASASLSGNPLQYVQSLLGAGNSTGSSATSSGGLDALFSSFTSLVTGRQPSNSGTAAGTVTSGLNSTLLSTGTLSALLSFQGLNGSAGTSGAAASSGGGTQSAGLEAPGAASQRQGHHGHHQKSLTDASAQLSTVAAPTTLATA